MLRTLVGLLIGVSGRGFGIKGIDIAQGRRARDGWNPQAHRAGAGRRADRLDVRRARISLPCWSIQKNARAEHDRVMVRLQLEQVGLRGSRDTAFATER